MSIKNLTSFPSRDEIADRAISRAVAEKREPDMHDYFVEYAQVVAEWRAENGLPPMHPIR